MIDVFSFLFFFRLLFIPKENGVYSKCSMYEANYTAEIANGLTEPNPSWKTIPCTNGWEFDNVEIPYSTIATEVKWILQNVWIFF